VTQVGASCAAVLAALSAWCEHVVDEQWQRSACVRVLQVVPHTLFCYCLEVLPDAWPVCAYVTKSLVESKTVSRPWECALGGS